MRILINTLTVILILTTFLWADSGSNEWYTPIEVHYMDASVDTLWIFKTAQRVPITEKIGGKHRPIPGSALYYVNKLPTGDSLTISRELYRAPDSIPFLVKEKITLTKVRLIIDATSDSLHHLDAWSDIWLDAKAKQILLEREPILIDTFVYEMDVAYDADHFYCYDSLWTKEKIRENIIKEYSDQKYTPALQKAIKKHLIIVIPQSSP